MKITYFEIQNIPCKLYEPEDIPVTRVILGVHGFAGDKESSALEALAFAMADFGTALVCFDFPAHGASSDNEAQFTVDKCIADLAAVDAWIRENFPKAEKAVFATSFGGYISLLSAQRFEGYRIVLRAPAVTMPEVLLSSVLHISAEEFESVGMVECGFERKICLPFAFYRDLLLHPVECTDRHMLIIHGSNDDVVPYSDVLSFCSRNPNASLVTVKGADHRFKKPGELDVVITAAKNYIIGRLPAK